MIGDLKSPWRPEDGGQVFIYGNGESAASAIAANDTLE